MEELQFSFTYFLPLAIHLLVLVLVAPAPVRKNKMKMMHNSVTSGQLGSDKTLSLSTGHECGTMYM